MIAVLVGWLAMALTIWHTDRALARDIRAYSRAHHIVCGVIAARPSDLDGLLQPGETLVLLRYEPVVCFDPTGVADPASRFHVIERAAWARSRGEPQ